jgi:hypothetical protein
VNLFALILSIIFLCINLSFLKKRLLEFKYSFLWMGINIIILILSVNIPLVEYMAGLVGIYYAPSFLFLLAILLCFMLMFYLMLVISNIQKKVTRLIQENAILRNEIYERKN